METLPLNDTERAIVKLIAQGRTLSQIAEDTSFCRSYTYELIRGLRRKLGARSYNRLVATFADRERERLDHQRFTAMEMRIADLLAQGLSFAEIAVEIDWRHNSVSNWVKILRRKTFAATTPDLIVKLIKMGYPRKLN